MNQLCYQSIKKLSSRIRSKEISAQELLDAYLNRISEVNPALNAVVQLSAGTACEQAAIADQALAEGRWQGPLHGIPMTIKDSFDTEGIISAGGTRGRAKHVPAKDATVVSRLRNAGAILLGKTNTSECTLTYDTDNLVYGQTNNPYNLNRTPGGSSGGAAAIVAAGGSAFDIGSDFGGSLRYPAHCCGITTIKPTSGRVPRTGHIMPFGGVLDSFQQVGPLARHTEDLHLLLSIISGPDWIDPAIVPMPLGDPGQVDPGGLKIAVHTDNGVVPASADTATVIGRAAELLAEAGAAVEKALPEGIEQTFEVTMELLSADGGASIRRLLRTAGTIEHSIPWLDLALEIGSDDFDARIMRWYGYRSRMLSFFKDFDVILCPANAFPAGEHNSAADNLESFSYTMAYNMTGWPGVVFRGGTSHDGLPIGIQIVAQPWREDVALAVASLLEAGLDGFQPPDM